VTRLALLAPPVAFGLAGLLLLATALATGSAAALAATVLLATLLLAQVADPPVGSRSPRGRAVARIGAASVALVLATVAMITALAAGFELVPRWQWAAAAGGLAALILLAPLALLGRTGLEQPVTRSERTLLTRAAAIGALLGGGMLVAGYVLPAFAAALAVGFALIAALEGVALARPGGAGLRRLASERETAAVDAAVATGPSEVIGHRRVVIRTTGGAEYLSLEVLVRQRPSEARTQELRAQLEQSIKGALPELVVSVRVRVGELPPPGPEDPTRQLDDTRTLLFDERASLTGDQQLTEVLDDNPTELIDEQPTEAVDAPVLPSAPWERR
jgi:hypothetical protein